MALDESQFYTDPATGTKYTSYASFQQNNQGVALPSTANPATGQAISLDQLNPATPINIPLATPKTDNLAGTTAGAEATSKSLDQYIKDLTPPETDTSKQYDKLSSDISALLPGLGGRGQEQVQKEQDAGLPEQKKALADLNAQILAGVAEAKVTQVKYDKAISDLAGTPGETKFMVGGQQAQLRRMQLLEGNAKAADLGLLQARALGLQGNIQAAQDSVNRAIDLKYSDREDELNLKMSQLKLLEGKLTKEEAITKTALERKYQDEQTKIAEEKANAKTNINTAIAAGVQTPVVNQNGKFFDARTGITFPTPEAFFKAFNISSFAEAYQKGLVTDVNGNTMAERDLAAQAQAKYSDVVIPLNATPEQVAKAIQGSRIYRKETYIAPVANPNPIPTNNPIVDTSTDAVVKDIIASHPGEYGQAADEIDKRFGKGTATTYDQWLKNVYNEGQNVYAQKGTDSTQYTPLQISRYTLGANRIVKNFIDLPQYQLTANGLPYLQRIAAASQTPGSVSDQELLDSFTKLNTAGNAVTEAQISLITGGKSLKDTLNTFQNKFKNGGVLSDNQRNQLREIASATYNNYKKGYQPVYDSVTKQLQATGIPKQFWTIPDLNTLSDQASGSGEITVKLKSTGQIGTIPNGEFDPNIYEKQ